MSITSWSLAVELFASVGKLNQQYWLRSRLSQTNNPVIIDAETPASTYNASETNDYAIYLQATDWLGDLDAPIKIGDTGPVSLPFSPFSVTIAQSSASGQDLDIAIWWKPSATVSGAYDVEFQNFSDNVNNVGTTTPALAAIGAPATLVSGVIDPLDWAYADNSQEIVYSYVTPASASTENITLQVFSPTGAALSTPVQADIGAPLSTIYRIDYFPGTSTFEFVESATVNGVQGFEFSSIAASGALGTAKFQAVPLGDGLTSSDPIAIDGVAFSTLKDGDILEFVGYRDTAGFPYWQGVKTRLLDSSFNDITASTSGFTSGGFENIGEETPAHWATASLSNGDTILIYTLNSFVTIEQFDATGNVIGNYEFSPQDSSGSSFSPNDFDSIVAMGDRFEVTYRRTSNTISGESSEVFSAIYDTSTQAANYTINDGGRAQGRWAGTPFDDTIGYGAGLNEVNGGGGTDTFVATSFTSSQVSVSINASNQVVFAVDANDVDTLERFSAITLADATLKIADDTLTANFDGGNYTITKYNIAGQPFTRKVFSYSASGQILSKLFEGVTGEGNLSAFEYRYAGGNLIGSEDYYTGITGEPYTREEADFDGAGRTVRVALGGVSGAPYSSYEYDYVGGVFAGSKFTYAAVPDGASYSSYEVDYNQANVLAGTKFFFANVSNEPYTGEEADYDANDHLTRVLLTGVVNQAYSSLELDYNAGVYDGYKAYYTVSGQSYASEEVDVSASGQLEKVVYSGVKRMPYQAVEQDFVGGALVSTTYGYTDVAGQAYNAYEVREDANGVGLTETFDLNSGGHNEFALASGQTLTSLGGDVMHGSGATTFVLDAIYGADTIANFNASDAVSLPSLEYAQLSQAIQNGAYVNGNATLSFSDGDTLTFKGVSQATLMSLSGAFSGHA